MPQQRKTDFCRVEKMCICCFLAGYSVALDTLLLFPSVDEGESANILFQLKVVGHFTHCQWVPIAEDSEPSNVPSFDTEEGVRI